MKLQSLVAAFMATGAVASAAHRKHEHFHQRRTLDVDGNKVVTDTTTVVMYSYNGKTIDEDTLCKGLINGSINWVGDDPPRPACGKEMSHEPALAGGSVNEVNSAAPVPISAKPSKHSGSPASSTGGSGAVFVLTNDNTEQDFPDGEMDCSEFPSAYGAIAVDWVGLDGWSGIQYAQVSAGFIENLATANPGQGGCKASSGGQYTFCSYACPAGFQKSQWPTVQGSSDSAVSVGGLKCDANGKLRLTNPQLSRKLCMRGTDTLTIVNNLGKGAAVCRTDYPGTESETVPVLANPGEEVPLTCPKSSQYYVHQGQATTAHYYVNDAGVSVDKACNWGKDESTLGESYGNWAPIVLGAGMDDNGSTWLSIQSSCQNNPTICNELSYSIELEGNFGGNNACFYTQSGGVGYWCSKGSLDTFDPRSSACQTKQTTQIPGCTVQLMSGKASYKFMQTN